MKVYIGYEAREQAAVDVAVKTLREVSGIEAELLVADRLRDAGMLSRISDHRGGQAYDLVSNAPKATAFAVSRFLTPLLCQGGWALFTDCDMVFLRDPREMLAECSTKGLKEIVFGVRPENLTLGTAGLPVTIDLVEELGADSFVHGHTPDGGRMVIRTDARIHPQAGSTVQVTVTDNEHLHLFDPNTGERLKSSKAVAADSSPIVSHEVPVGLLEK